MAHHLHDCRAPKPHPAPFWWWQTSVKRFGISGEGHAEPALKRLALGTPDPPTTKLHRKRVHRIPYSIPSRGTLYFPPSSATSTFLGGRGVQSPLRLHTLPACAQGEGERAAWKKKGGSRLRRSLLFSTLITTAHPLSITFSFCTNN